MHLPPSDPFDPIVHRRPSNPKDLLEANPATLRRRFVFGLAGCAVGLPCSGVGFFEVSVFNPSPPAWYGMGLLIVGLILLVGGVVSLVLAHPKLFDSGNRGI